jgi:hypothetical protein
VYEAQNDDPSAMVISQLSVVAKGYTAVKVLLTPPTESLNSHLRPIAMRNDVCAPCAMRWESRSIS